MSVADSDRVVRGSGDGCAWCGASLGSGRRRFCSKTCRQTAFRVRKRAGVGDVSSDALFLPSSTAAGAFAYADPPYLGVAARYYSAHHPQAAEWDDPAAHAELIETLQSRGYDGWALSASPGSLATILPMCPRGARVAAWVKPIGVSSRTWGMHNTWEPVVVVGGRPRRPGVRDWLRAMPARGGDSDLIGRKPLAFCAWLFDLLGMVHGDRLDDLFPGSGVVSRAWRELSATPRPRLASLSDRETSPGAGAPSLLQDTTL
jgi:hypothetical protein